MSKSYEPQIKWRVNEIEELVASMKERELLTISDGKKRRSLEVFSVVRSDLQRKGIFRTEEQIRKKMNELRKQYFEANRSGPENRYEQCEHYDVLHDLFTDAQRKLDKRTERSRTRSKRRHSQNGPDAPTSIQSNASKSNRRSISGSSVCSSVHSSKHNGYEQNHHSPQQPLTQQQQQQQNGGDAIHNGGRRNHVSEPVLPDKFHLKQCAYQPNLNNSLTNLCKNDRYADVMLLVCNDDDSIAIPAHRLVLGTFSPYFANVFEKFTFVPSSPIIYVALPPTVTRAAMQCLLQYMYTGEAIVHSRTLDDVMMCGEFLRINGFSSKKASSMLKNHQGLVSVPLVTVTKTINMDASLQNDARRESSTPAPTTITTRSSPPTPVPVPVPMTMRPYYDSQSPPRKMARHYEPLQQQTLFQQPEYLLTHQAKREMQQLQREMYQDELLDQQLLQQAQRSQMLPQRQPQFARPMQQYQSQHVSEDLFQPMPILRQQQQQLMMQPLQSTMLQQRQLQQQRYATAQQLQPLDMDMEQDLLQPPLQTMPMQRQRQQQLMPTQSRPLHSLQSQAQLQDMYGPQSLPLSRQAQPLQQYVQTQQSQEAQQQQGQGQLKQQNMALLQQPQRQMVLQSSSQQQRLRMQSQQSENEYQSNQQLQDDLQDSEPLLESQQLLEPLQPRQRQPTAQLQQQLLQPRGLQQRSTQPQTSKSQHQLQEDQLPVRQELLESQELLEPAKPSQQPQRTLQQPTQMEDDLMKPQELLETQELLAPVKVRQTQQQRQQLHRMLQQRVATQQQKMQDEVIKPQELLDTQELLEPQKPRQTPQVREPVQQLRVPQQSEQKQLQQIQRLKQQQQQQQVQLQPKQQNNERQLQQQKTQTKQTMHNNVCEPEPVAKSSKEGIPQPMLNDSTSKDDGDVPGEAKDTSKDDEGETQNDKSLDDSVLTRSDSEVDYLEKPRKNSIFEEFPDHRKFEDHEQRKKEFIKEYEEHMKNSQLPLVETPESSPSVPPVSPKSPVVERYRSKSPLPSTVTMQHRKPCSQRREPSPRPDIIEALDSMVTLTSDESMMEIITKSPESQTSHFSTRSHSPDSQAKINALIEDMGIPDTDTAIFVNSSMDSQSCADLDDDSNDHQEGMPLDQLVSSRLNCQLCYESFTTPPEWVQHVSGHCIVDQGLLKRRRISNEDGSDNDSHYFRCDMCSSYFILAQDWQNHVANNHEAAVRDV